MHAVVQQTRKIWREHWFGNIYYICIYKIVLNLHILDNINVYSFGCNLTLTPKTFCLSLKMFQAIAVFSLTWKTFRQFSRLSFLWFRTSGSLRISTGGAPFDWSAYYGLISPDLVGNNVWLELALTPSLVSELAQSQRRTPRARRP